MFELRPIAVDGGEHPEIEDAVAAVEGMSRGRGFSQQLTVADRKAIEARAMELAAAYFEGLGYTVDDVSANQPYDLRCTRRRGPPRCRGLKARPPTARRSC